MNSGNIERLRLVECFCRQLHTALLEIANRLCQLTELGTAAGDWPEVATNARRFLQVNPLVAAPWRALAQAAAVTGDDATAITANRTLLKLDPANPAEVHYELARLLHRRGDTEARGQVLRALEEAPRHRAALNLLLELGPDATAR